MSDEPKKPTGVKKGQAILRDPDLRRARALAIIQRKITRNMSSASIAKEFNLSTHTVENEIDYAKRQGLVAGFEDQILNDLVPAAIKAFKAALDSGDAQVALEVLKGTGLLRKPSDKPLTTALPTVEEETLEIYTRKRVRGGTPNATQFKPKPRVDALPAYVPSLPEAPSGTVPVHEGHLLEDAAPCATSPASSVGASGDEDRAPDA